MKKLIILAVATGFVGTTMMTTEAMARRGGSLKITPKHHQFAAAERAVRPSVPKGSGKTRARAPKFRLIKVHGSVIRSIKRK